MSFLDVTAHDVAEIFNLFTMFFISVYQLIRPSSKGALAFDIGIPILISASMISADPGTVEIMELRVEYWVGLPKL